MKLFKLLFFFLLIFPLEMVSQDSPPEVRYDQSSEVQPISFDEESINSLKKNDDYDYTELEDTESTWDRFKAWLGRIWSKFWTWLLGDYEASGFWSFIIKTIPYLIIAGIIVFIIWLFIRLNPGAKLLQSKEAPQAFFTEEEEIVRSKDIHKLIQEALENKDFRLAVRYYYLLILRKLTEGELIAYEFDKTNTDYISEIVSKELNRHFRKVTTLYDYIWYGNFEVTHEDYKKAQVTFNRLEQQIDTGFE
ncbi:MAG: DUF4129 domain-containing protein [Bacteroidota bacterium]